MTALAQIFSYIFETLFGLYALIVLLRFVFQLVKADFYNPISQGIVKLTSPILIPLRKIIPGFYGLDLAALFLVLAIHVISIILTALLQGINPFESISVILVFSALKFFSGFMNIFTFSLLVSIVLSFVAPTSNHPAAVLTQQIAEPMMAPFRKLIPPFGGIDISPIFVFLALGVITRVLFIIGSAFNIPIQQAWLFVFV